MRRMFGLAVLVAVAVFIGSSDGKAAEELQGIQRLACQARLCLSTGSPPGECSAALAYYYSIKFKSGSKTARKRQEFLDKCPMVGQVPSDDEVNGAVAVRMAVDADGYVVSLGVMEEEAEGELALAACSACEGDAAVSGDASP